MKSHWKLLRAELAIWQDQGLHLPFWWRDDDATEPSAALDRLLDMAQGFQMPVHLAVIPAHATPALAQRLQGNSLAVPVTHGYAHQNHAPAGQKKCEYSGQRNQGMAQGEITNGMAKMQGLFGENHAPLFVPPWNRFATDFLPLLSDAGYNAISTFTPRIAQQAHKGLLQINTHLDPIDWHGKRTVHDPDMLVAQATELLEQRRSGATDNGEALGFLTHHLVHDAAIWEFTNDFIETMLTGPVTFWNARDLKGQKT